MFEVAKLSPEDIKRCLNTVSSNTFYMMVANAILSKESLSVVRMGDGEKSLMDKCEGILPAPTDRDIEDGNWMETLGCSGITDEALYSRLQNAANECTWFAPSISGIGRKEYNLYKRFAPRDRYIDNFWCNAWTDEMKINLYKAAMHILFIHRNPLSFAALKVRAKKIGVEASYIQLDNWRESEDVIDQASKIDAPLVLFSAGPASKYIGHRISVGGNIPKVALDLGNSSDEWLLYCLHKK
jgi:hypothetical protein